MSGDGGYAFAAAAENGRQSGMTLRDYFAAQVVGMLIGYHGYTPEYDNYQKAAADAYAAADAMLAERAKATGAPCP